MDDRLEREVDERLVLARLVAEVDFFVPPEDVLLERVVRFRLELLADLRRVAFFLAAMSASSLTLVLAA